MNIDQSYSAFERIYDWAQQHGDKINNEAATRFHLIDRVLTECLGWQHEKIDPEVSTDSGYVDYLLTNRDYALAVIEAKKSDGNLVSTQASTITRLSVSGPGLKASIAGIAQARRYCIEKGTPYAILSNGNQWVFFLAYRSDGLSPEKSVAIVFPSLQSVRDSYARFFDLLSVDQVQSKHYNALIAAAEGLQLVAKKSYRSAFNDSDIKLQARKPIEHQLSELFEHYFGLLSGDSNKQDLIDCFVETKESSTADETLQSLVQNLIEKLQEIGGGEGLTDAIQSAVAQQDGGIALIIGNKGAGKTTFISRFFDQILDAPTKKKCAIIRIDVGSSEGELSGIASWLRRRLVNELEKVLFPAEGPDFNDIRGVFNGLYMRLSRAEYSDLHDKDQTAFRRLFGDRVRAIVEADSDEYLQLLLNHCSRNRSLMPCIVLDNTDHFPNEFQDAVFQYAHWVRKTAFSFVVCPITDRTVWRLSKSGPLQSFASHSFYLPVPKVGEILSRRVDLLKSRIKEGRHHKSGVQQFGAGTIQIQDLEAFAACVESAFLNTPYVSRLIGQLANYDIRRCLDLARRLISSHAFGLGELIKIYFSKNEKIYVSQYAAVRALIVQDKTFFCERSSEYILNTYEPIGSLFVSPILICRLLKFYVDLANSKTEGGDQYATVSQAEQYFSSLGVSDVLIRQAVTLMFDRRLIEAFDAGASDLSECDRFRISPAGRAHYRLSTKSPAFVREMSLVTGIDDKVLRQKIRSSLRLRIPQQKKSSVAFLHYLIGLDKHLVQVPNSAAFDGQRQVLVDLYGILNRIDPGKPNRPSPANTKRAGQRKRKAIKSKNMSKGGR